MLPTKTFQLTNVIPEKIIFISRGITVYHSSNINKLFSLHYVTA